MSFLKKSTIILVSVFVLSVVIANTVLALSHNNDSKARNVAINKIAGTFQTEMQAGHSDSHDYPQILQSILEKQGPVLETALGKKALPSNVYFVSSDKKVPAINVNAGTYAYPVFIYDTDEQTAGILFFEYPDHSSARISLFVNLTLAVVFFILLIFIIVINRKVFLPFNTLKQYPEKLALGNTTDKLPESKDKYFGKYIWAMNMLSDILANEKKTNARLSAEKQKLISTIAHEIKTPVANIKLYARAIQTGLYSPDGIQNQKDAEIAGKIDGNADYIQKLVDSLLNNSMKSLFDYEPEISSFYVDELKVHLITEYENRMLMNHIPYEVECTENLIIRTDKKALYKILFQLLDNAIKYGDGQGIQVRIESQREGVFISVMNKGIPPSENEIPYLFYSFWRGSNATGTEGQGIGLYEAKQIARKLNGDIFVHTEDTSTEFLLSLSQEETTECNWIEEITNGGVSNEIKY